MCNMCMNTRVLLFVVVYVCACYVTGARLHVPFEELSAESVSILNSFR